MIVFKSVEFKVPVGFNLVFAVISTIVVSFKKPVSNQLLVGSNINTYKWYGECVPTRYAEPFATKLGLGKLSAVDTCPKIVNGWPGSPWGPWIPCSPCGPWIPCGPWGPCSPCGPLIDDSNIQEFPLYL